MEEQALNVALETLRKGKSIAILDLKSKEAETDLFFPTSYFFPLYLRTLKAKTGGELYIFVVHEVASTFIFLFIKEKYPILQHMGKEKKQMFQGSCSMGFSFDHRSLKTGVLDVEKKVVNLKNEVDRKDTTRLFGEEFHTPSHIFLWIENASGLQVHNGHTEPLVAFAKLVGIIPILICWVCHVCKDRDNFGALPLEIARAWASRKNILFLVGPDIIKAIQGFGARS
ncbi:hypothetical protein CY35_08G133200 [Sphagnum magellanicum]|nr:hypothetical protein CY35_08G133200 [Sphagnum magellanicum]